MGLHFLGEKAVVPLIEGRARATIPIGEDIRIFVFWFLWVKLSQSCFLAAFLQYKEALIF